MKIDKISLDNYITGNYGEDEQKLQKSMLFNLEEIKEAVDWAVGDDGFRSKEVIEILKVDVGEDKRAYIGEQKNEHS